MSSAMNNATVDVTTGKDRVYGGDTGLIHVSDGQRAQLGRDTAEYINNRMKLDAFASGARTEQQIVEQNLCPGCYMVVLFNTAVELAKRNGQSLSELGNSMTGAFKKLAEGGQDSIEEIEVVLDPEPMNEIEMAMAMNALCGPWLVGGAVCA